jgi:DNA repair protein RAD5
VYIGEFLIPNAWSNVSGKGYIKIDDLVKIERDGNESTDNKTSNKKKGDGKKQMTLSAMLKNQPSKSSKKKNNIVRLLNSRGFGWIYSLLFHFVDVSQSLEDSPRTFAGGWQSL